jgi:DNA-binding NarL/FixJ family response regulator
MPVTLLLADDHQIVRQGLRALLAGVPDFQLVGEASNGLEAVYLTEKLRPHVLVLDLMMPCLNGFQVARRIGQSAPQTRIVVLSMHANEAYVSEACRAGARAYVLKDAGADDLIEAIRSAVAGRSFYRSATPRRAKADEPASEDLAVLTARERQVLLLTAEGDSSNEIARRLFISPRTVESHRSNLMRKLHLRNQKELVRFALENGVVAGGRRTMVDATLEETP